MYALRHPQDMSKWLVAIEDNKKDYSYPVYTWKDDFQNALCFSQKEAIEVGGKCHGVLINVRQKGDKIYAYNAGRAEDGCPSDGKGKNMAYAGGDKHSDTLQQTKPKRGRTKKGHAGDA